jgi:hypothetical protein
LFFFCCGSVAALPALANCNGHVAKTYISRPHPPTPSAYALFLRRAPHLQAVSLREISHMQAGQCGNEMGTMLLEVVCDENSICGGGEYLGDNDAQLGRINACYSLV